MCYIYYICICVLTYIHHRERERDRDRDYRDRDRDREYERERERFGGASRGGDGRGGANGRSAPAVEPNRTLVVRSMDLHVTEELLRDTFERCVLCVGAGRAAGA